MSGTLTPYLLLSAALLALGIFGLLCRRNVVAMLISLELVLSSANLNFVALDHFVFQSMTKGAGQVFAIFVIALAAAEVCVALSIALVLFRRHRSVSIENARELRG